MTEPIDNSGRAPRQRSARTDPAMRDGDSAHGSPYESAGDEVALDSDTDVGDADRPDESLTENTIDNVLKGKTGRETLSVAPEAFERMADPHAGPEAEAEADEEEDAAEAADADLPIANYSELNVGEVVARARSLSAADRRAVLAYEKQHHDRVTLVSQLEKMLDS